MISLELKIGFDNAIEGKNIKVEHTGRKFKRAQRRDFIKHGVGGLAHM